MKKFGLILVVLLWASLGYAQQRMSLDEALAQKLVQVVLKNNGGFRGPMLKIWFKNVSGRALSLEVSPGQQFASDDTAIQDLIVTAPLMVALEANETEAHDLYTMCTQSYNMSPYRGATYRSGGRAEGALGELAQKIADGNYQNSTAQSAVWAVANGRGHRAVYGEDTNMVRDLAETVGEANGVDLSQFDLAPRRHHITNINTSFTQLLDRHLKEASLRLYDPEGELMWAYFSGKNLEKGFYQCDIGINHTLDSAAELSLQLWEGEELVAERTVLASDTLAPRQRYHSEALLTYELPRDAKVDVGVYDAEGQLYFLLAEDYFMRRGAHRSQHIVGVDLPPEQDFYVGVKLDGELLVREYLDPNAEEPLRQARRNVSEEAVVKLEEVVLDGTIGVYDAQGRLLQQLYKVSRLNPGKRTIRYQFSHFEGPGAVFYFRVIDGDGKVHFEQKIIDQ